MNRLLILLPLLLLLGGCEDTTHVDAVSALGPEIDGIPTGPNHRAGQPCTTCHGDRGPADSAFSVAGTIYRVRGEKEPLGDARIIVTDAARDVRTVRSNQIGNFFIRTDEWKPIFPLSVEIEAEDVRRKMVTTIGRDGGCATCHRDKGDRFYAPAVFLRDK